MSRRRAKYLDGAMCVAQDCSLLADHGTPAGPLCDNHSQRFYKRGTTEKFVSKGTSSFAEYKHWQNMKSRCNTPSATQFDRYGGRGIKVCPEWEASFESFLKDMGPRPGKGYSVDRIDHDGNYEPSNCRWATATEQARNTSLNRIVSIEGREQTLAEAVEGAPVPYNTILYRLKRGWAIEDAIRYPAHKGLRPWRTT